MYVGVPSLQGADIGVQDLTQETNEKITPEHLVKLLEEMFQNTTS
jgi:hypothetical protein